MEFIVPNIAKKVKVKMDKKAFRLLMYKLILMSYP